MIGYDPGETYWTNDPNAGPVATDPDRTAWFDRRRKWPGSFGGVFLLMLLPFLSGG